MKIKNCKVGTRVVAKVDVGGVQKGDIGTIIEGNNEIPCVTWDIDRLGTYHHKGYTSVYATSLWKLKRIKE